MKATWFSTARGIDQGMPYRKLFFPIEHGNNSYLVLVQTEGETLSDAGKVASPIVASIEFS